MDAVEDVVMFFAIWFLSFLLVFSIIRLFDANDEAEKNKQNKIHELCLKNGNTWVEGTCIPGKTK